MTLTAEEVVGYRPNGTNVVFHPKFRGRWSPEPRMADGRRYPTMGYPASAWIEATCGLELDPWEVEILRRAWLYDPDTHDWVVEDVLIVGPEGIGKSAFFAGVGLWLLDGPCVPPMEAPSAHPRPNIPVVSAALSLTEHIHRHAKHYVERDGSPLDGRLVVENTKIYRAAQESHALLFPAGSGAYQQGAEPVPAILEEELHVLGQPGIKATGEETIRILSSKRSKNRNVQRFTITNPDDGDPESLLGERWTYASKILDGEIDDPSLLVVHFHAAQPVDVDDPDDLRRGIVEATPASWVDPEEIARKYEKGEQGIGWTMRFSLGLFYAGDDQVLPDGALRAAAGKVPDGLRVPPPPSVPCALTFDGARSRDSMALMGCTPEGYGWTVEAWERPDDADDRWRYPKLDVHRRVVQAMDHDHPDALLGVDPTWFEDLVYGWSYTQDDGRTVQVPGWVELWPDRVVVDVQQYGSQAWTGFRRAVVDGTYTFDGDPRLARHMRNAKEIVRTRQGRSYPVLAKKRDDGKHPIDMLVCATYAHRLATHAEASDEPSVAEWREALGLTGDEEP